MRGHVTEKVDVFAFGVVVLETLAGRPNYYITEDQNKIYIFEWVSSPRNGLVFSVLSVKPIVKSLLNIGNVELTRYLHLILNLTFSTQFWHM